MKTRFSKHFHLNRKQIDLDFVDIFLEKDTPLFIDPRAIKEAAKIGNGFCCKAMFNIQSFFDSLLQTIKGNDKNKGLELLNFLHEKDSSIAGCIHLGLSKKKKGLAIAEIQAEQLYDSFASSYAVKSGLLSDLEDTALMIEGFGPDKVSDIVANIIGSTLIEYTQQQCFLYDIELKKRHGINIRNGDQRYSVPETELPFVDGIGKIILVPKLIVRKNGLYVNDRDFYNKSIIEFEQSRYLDARSSLCRVLKDDSRKEPTKKDMYEEMPISRAMIVDYIQKYPELLEDFKTNKIKYSPISNESIQKKQEDAVNPDDEINNIKSKINMFKKIKPGKDDATKYHNHILDCLQNIFYPSLQNPIKEKEINDGRKRIDISFSNSATSGFFGNLTKYNIACSRIYFECKNYSQDIQNPEFDQLAGRFNVRVTMIGFVVCRTIEDKEKVIESCKDFVFNQNKYIIVLSDDDIIQLLEMKSVGDEIKISQYIEGKLEEIVSR